MNKYVDFIIALILSMFVFLIWYLKSMFASTVDNFNFGIAALILFNLSIFTHIYCSYLLKTNLILINLILVILLIFCWFSSIKISFTYNYFIIDTAITALCFMLSIVHLVYIVINAINKYSNVQKNNKNMQKEAPSKF